MPAQLYRPFEDLLNRGISASGEATRLSQTLAGRRLCIELRGLPLSLQITATEQGIALSDQADSPADCTLSGLPLSLARLGLTGDPDVFRKGAVSISGDPVLAQDFQRLLDLARPDWEEELSRLVGDVAAHQLGNAARDLMRWSLQAADTLGRDTSEYLREESRDLPTRFEVDEFLDQVDELSGDIDRAEARLQRLERRASGPAGIGS
ncbi:MAG: SCP2 sterol-binding domain-containing protein [Gammaproteobacteria bacterium]